MWFDTAGVLLTSGTGVGRHEISSFDFALRAAGIGDFNLIRVTSIVPPGVEVFGIPDGEREVIGQGRMLPTVYEVATVDSHAEEVSVGIGIGVPIDKSKTGVIFTDKCAGSTARCEGRLAEMVEDGMGFLGRSDEYNLVTETTSVTASEPGLYNSAVASLSFCDNDLLTFFVTKRPH